MTHRPLLALLLAAPLFGCPSEPANRTDATYWADIKPMLQTYCTRCHQPGGQGAGDFTDDEVAMALAPRMVARVAAGEMPPPASDPDCRDYQGSERMVMPDASKALLEEWVEGGQPEGDPADLVSVETQELSLPSNDLVVQMPTAYAPTYADAENPGNEYRCFALEHDRTEPFFITGLAPIVGAPSIVHHIVLFKMPSTALWDGYDPAVGRDCINGAGGVELDGMIAGWAPGGLPIQLEEGQGIRVEADDLIVLQMHYFLSGPEAVGVADRSGYEFTTSDTATTPIRMFPVGTYDFRIPAGDADYSARDSIQMPNDVGATVHAVFPHMHVLGTHQRVWADDGVADTCVTEGDYEFANQLSYFLKEPVTVGPGERLHLECTWDNSAENPNQFFDPPQEIRYGERTDEEMCFAFALTSLSFQ